MNKTIACLILLVGVFISALSQVALKKSSNKTYKNIIGEYLNPHVIISYGIFFIITLVNVIVLKYIPLSLVPILESTSFIFITGFSFFFLGEKINKKQMFFLILIVLGIVIFAIF